MNIVITAVTPAKVTINGQPMAREYAEGVLLPLLVAAQGKNQSAVLKVAEVFTTAGLSLQACPGTAHDYRCRLAEQAALKAQQLAEAKASAERCRVPTPKEIAEKKAARAAEAARIRDIGAAMRAQLGR